MTRRVIHIYTYIRNTSPLRLIRFYTNATVVRSQGRVRSEGDPALVWEAKWRVLGIEKRREAEGIKGADNAQ